jgi:hypothetical protein
MMFILASLVVRYLREKCETIHYNPSQFPRKTLEFHIAIIHGIEGKWVHEFVASIFRIFSQFKTKVSFIP